jgi:L-threonylcarbamoyladenylate synthase
LSLFDEGSAPAVQAALAQGGKQAVVAFSSLPPFLADVHGLVCVQPGRAALCPGFVRHVASVWTKASISILVQRCPDTPDWQAVNDRLGRAAAAFE